MKQLKVFLVTLLVFGLSVPPGLQAQQLKTHVVSLDMMRAAVATRSSERTAHIQEIQKLLRHEEVRNQIKAFADLDKIERAIPSLDNDTLSQLAAQSRSVNDQIQAGMGTVGWVILAGVLVAVVILVYYAAALCANEGGC